MRAQPNTPTNDVTFARAALEAAQKFERPLSAARKKAESRYFAAKKAGKPTGALGKSVDRATTVWDEAYDRVVDAAHELVQTPVASAGEALAKHCTFLETFGSCFTEAGELGGLAMEPAADEVRLAYVAALNDLRRLAMPALPGAVEIALADADAVHSALNLADGADHEAYEELDGRSVELLIGKIEGDPVSLQGVAYRVSRASARLDLGVNADTRKVAEEDFAAAAEELNSAIRGLRNLGVAISPAIEAGFVLAEIFDASAFVARYRELGGVTYFEADAKGSRFILEPSDRPSAEASSMFRLVDSEGWAFEKVRQLVEKEFRDKAATETPAERIARCGSRVDERTPAGILARQPATWAEYVTKAFDWRTVRATEAADHVAASASFREDAQRLLAEFDAGQVLGALADLDCSALGGGWSFSRGLCGEAFTIFGALSKEQHDALLIERDRVEAETDGWDVDAWIYSFRAMGGSFMLSDGVVWFGRSLLDGADPEGCNTAIASLTPEQRCRVRTSARADMQPGTIEMIAPDQSAPQAQALAQSMAAE